MIDYSKIWVILTGILVELIGIYNLITFPFSLFNTLLNGGCILIVYVLMCSNWYTASKTVHVDLTDYKRRE